MRLFVAVAVPVHAADELDNAVAPLRQSWPGLRWTGRDAWHLTLAFLGEVTEPVCARLTPRLERAAGRRPRPPCPSPGPARSPPRPGPACCGAGCGANHASRRLAALAASVARDRGLRARTTGGGAPASGRI